MLNVVCFGFVLFLILIITYVYTRQTVTIKLLHHSKWIQTFVDLSQRVFSFRCILFSNSNVYVQMCQCVTKFKPIFFSHFITYYFFIFNVTNELVTEHLAFFTTSTICMFIAISNVKNKRLPISDLFDYKFTAFYDFWSVVVLKHFKSECIALSFIHYLSLLPILPFFIFPINKLLGDFALRFFLRLLRSMQLLTTFPSIVYEKMNNRFSYDLSGDCFPTLGILAIIFDCLCLLKPPNKLQRNKKARSKKSFKRTMKIHLRCV